MLFVEVWLRNGNYTAAEYFDRFWYEIAFELQLWIYLGVIWFKVRRYEIMIRDTYSSIDSITLSWMRNVIIAFALALAAGTVSYVLFFLVITYRLMYLFAPLAAVFSAYYISYKAFHEPDVFLVAKPVLRAEPPENSGASTRSPAYRRRTAISCSIGSIGPCDPNGLIRTPT